MGGGGGWVGGGGGGGGGWGGGGSWVGVLWDRAGEMLKYMSQAEILSQEIIKSRCSQRHLLQFEFIYTQKHVSGSHKPPFGALGGGSSDSPDILDPR